VVPGSGDGLSVVVSLAAGTPDVEAASGEPGWAEVHPARIRAPATSALESLLTAPL
jgi:hypothetical protein